MELTVEILANLYDAVTGIVFISAFCGKKLRDNKIGFLLMLLTFAISTFFLFVEVHVIIHSLLILALLILYAAIINKGVNLRTIIAPIVFEGSLIASSTVLMFILGNVFKINITELIADFGFHRCLFLFLCKILMTSVLIIAVRFFALGTRFKTVELILYLISPAMTIIMLSTLISVSVDADVEKYYLVIALSSIGLVVTNALALIFFNKSSRMEEKEHEMTLLNQLAVSEQKRYAETESMYESMRIIKHDLKEQLSYVESQFARGNSSEAERMLSEISNSISANNSIVHTGNRIIDNILYSKSSLHPDVHFMISGTVYGIDSFEEAKIVALFFNMLDNAIEGLSGQNEKVIELAFSNIGGYWNVTCKNPVLDSVLTENPDLKTTKNDKQAHGYGVKSMKQIVSSMNGMIEFYESDGCFCCHVALPTENAQ